MFVHNLIVDLTHLIIGTACALVVARWLAELWLARLNRRHVAAHAHQIPEAFKGVIDESTYARSVQYTLARNRFGQIRDTYSMVLLLVLLLSAILPWSFHATLHGSGTTAFAVAAYLILAALALSSFSLPLDWIEQFRLEERFGFNTTTHKTWWLDRLKGALLAVLLGYPLVLLLLKIVEWTGSVWWLWAWAALLAFQFVMTILAPVLILPLFNKLTPLPEGSLKDRLAALAERTRFNARSIQVMDGSRRSLHSNAFFTGFGQFRKIVLFDTLIEQLKETELEAVLAHEIGHYKRKHIVKMLFGTALGTLAGFFVMACVTRWPAFVGAFGFTAPEPDQALTAADIAPVMLLVGLFSGTLTFWLSPLLHWISRRYEYEADAFAHDVMQDGRPLISALRKLNEKNLSNLTPHPVYSGFYYSHPTLIEREAALTSS